MAGNVKEKPVDLHTFKSQAEVVEHLQALIALQGSLLSRVSHFARLGYQYNGDRDLYEALGYKTDLDYQDYYAQWKRQDIARAVINKPVSTTWTGDLELLESTDDETTPLEKEWRELNKRLGMRSIFTRLDRLVCLGHYGVLLLGLNDVPTKDIFRQAVRGGKRELLYVRPFAESSAQIMEWDNDPNSPRYGKPLIYQLTVFTESENVTEDIQAHYSRVIHVPGEDLLESELQGSPKLEVVFNRLKDLEKLVGASAEMFWRGARPGYAAKVDPDYMMTTGTIDDLKDQIDEYEHNLRRILVNQGLDLNSLAQQVADPSSHVDIQIQMISAVTGIPKRILTGSERGELASSQDRDNWFGIIQSRREEYSEPVMVRPFINRCIELGVLPAVKSKEDGYTIKWDSLYEQSEKDLVDVGKTRAEALKSYASDPSATSIIPPASFLRLFLKLDSDEIQLIEEELEAMVEEEEKAIAEGEKAEEREEPEEEEETPEK